MHTKFEMLGFIRFNDTTEAQKLKIGHERPWLHPFHGWFVIRRLQLNCYDQYSYKSNLKSLTPVVVG